MGITNKDNQLALTKTALPAPNVPRANIVSFLLLLFPLALGILLNRWEWAG